MLRSVFVASLLLLAIAVPAMALQTGDTPGLPPTVMPPPILPALTVQGGYDWHVGDTIFIVLSFHAPNTSYDLYFCNIPGPCVFIGRVDTDGTGLAGASYTIPTNTPTGDYMLQSRPATDPAAIVAQNTIHVSTSLPPVVLVNATWLPAGSALQIGLANHTPTTTFQIKWGLQPTADTNIGTISTDDLGDAAVGSLVYTIPQVSPAGTYLVDSGLATRTVQVLCGCIKVNQGDCGQTITVPAGVVINIVLQSHAANRAYQVQFNGVSVPGSPVTTSAVGEALLNYIIPAATANGTYTIRSLDGTSLIATVQIVVNTPSTPSIYLPGYTWPAGSSATYQLRNHQPSTRYDVHWEGTQIETSTLTDAYGWAQLNYTIPITTAGATTYTLASYLSSNHTLTGQSADITVIAQPYLVIREGNPQVPGSTVHIDLHNHPVNTQYTLYVGGSAIPNGTVTTDVSGTASVVYAIPTDLTGGSYAVESRQGDSVMAATNLDMVVKPIYLPLIFKRG
jgi:hypothetical protein